jgi:hypothetical protein
LGNFLVSELSVAVSDTHWVNYSVRSKSEAFQAMILKQQMYKKCEAFQAMSSRIIPIIGINSDTRGKILNVGREAESVITEYSFLNFRLTLPALRFSP